MKILITGAAGFIGSHLTDWLYNLNSDDEFFGIDDYSGGSEENVRPIIQMYTADCRDEAEMDRIFAEVQPEVCFHLAANAAENKAQFSPVDITSRNYDAFVKVLKAFIKNKGKRFIFVSSIAVYGDGLSFRPFHEHDDPRPKDLYGISKLAAEQTLKVMAKVHDFEYVIVRPHNVYGPRQNMKDPYRNVVMIWINAILNKKPIQIYGDGEQERCFSYVVDVAAALADCARSKLATNRTFNVGSDRAYTLNHLAELLSVLPSRVPELQYLPHRVQEVERAVSSHVLAKQYLGYKDLTTLREGVRKTWEWAQQKGPCEPEYDELELVNNKVPVNWRAKV